MKTTLRKLTALLLALCTLFTLIGCNSSDEKYEISFKVVGRDGEEFIYSPEEEEKHITIPYDGKEHSYWIKSWRLHGAKNTNYNDWIKAENKGECYFENDILCIGEDGKNYSMPNMETGVKEKGKYVFILTAETHIFNRKKIKLYVSIE